MSRKLLGIALLLAILPMASCKSQKQDTAETFKPTDFVDPWIGTGGHGHVFLGASVPWGMVQLGPTSTVTGWDWCSGYHVSDSTIIGFSHTHLSGTGIGDLLDITVMPVVLTFAPGEETNSSSGLWSYSRRSEERVEPGYYATHLERYAIDVELTATNRIGYHKYVYPTDPTDRAIIFNLQDGGNWDKPTEAYIIKVNDRQLEGYRYSTGWAKNQKVYFAVELSQPMADLEVIADGHTLEKEGKGTIVYGRILLRPSESNTVMMRVALSPTSIEGAWKNMRAEAKRGWDFDQVRADAKQLWNDELSKIKIESSLPDVKKIFYTGLYHTMIAPSTFCDVDGRYYGADQEVHEGQGFTTHTIFSLWDTYRAAHPLMTLIHPEKMPDMVGTWLSIYDEQGELPIWHLMGNETYTMVGSPGIPVLADAILKGYVTDKERAYTALKASAMKPSRGQEYRMEYGYIPYTKMLESVAYDLEYALADWSVAMVAKALGHTDDYTYFLKRSKSYQKHFDPVTGFMRGVDEKGRFNPDFNPVASTHRNDDYCEGNAWQYTFLVPHDVHGLVECFGSEERFVSKLDSLFTIPSIIEGEDVSPDISGLIGQFAQGNEPSHHIPYMYSMLGLQSKAAPLLRQVMTELYHADYDGLSGNEDAGQMSAWYILSALGFYQIEPAGGRYYFGTPMIDSAEIKVSGGVLTIRVLDNSPENIYIQSIRLNGEPLTQRYITFEQITQGGQLEIQMGALPHNW